MPVIDRIQNVSTAHEPRRSQRTQVSADTQWKGVETITGPASQSGGVVQAFCQVDRGRQRGLDDPGQVKQQQSQRSAAGPAAHPGSAAEHFGLSDT